MISSRRPGASRRRTAVVLASVALLAAGCGSDGEASEDPTPVGSTTATSGATEATDGATTGATDGATSGAAGGGGDDVPPDQDTLPSGDGTTVAVEQIVEGFPSDVIPLPPGATVTTTSIVPTGAGPDVVSLSGTSDATPEEIRAFYAAALTKAGFTQAGNSPEGGTVFARTDGQEVITVVVLTQGGKQSFSVGGSLLPTP